VLGSGLEQKLFQKAHALGLLLETYEDIKFDQLKFLWLVRFAQQLAAEFSLQELSCHLVCGIDKL